MPDTTDLYTSVKNVSGAEKFFGFLGRHGKRLANNGTTTVFGGDVPHLYGYNKRKQTAFEAALTDEALVVLKTPRPLLLDAAADAALTAPSTTATVAATGGGASGGLLAAGTYQVNYTFYNAWGETTAGGRSATFTVAATNIPRVTLPAIPSGATGIKVYLTNTDTPSGTTKYYNKITSGTTLDLAVASWTEGTTTYSAAAAAPSSNTTAAGQVRGVTVADNTLGTTDPSWGRY